MPIYQLRLLDRRIIARNTLLCEFEKPANLHFKAGQYGGFTLLNTKENDDKGLTRRFSLLATPKDHTLKIATRVQDSAFKRGLDALKKGEKIKFAGPTGNFTLPHDLSASLVMIAGGIGVAPFYSMIKHSIQLNSPQHITLFYGNQTREDSAFLEEFFAFAKQSQHFDFIPTLSQADDTWTGERGFISREMLTKYVSDLNLPLYYICGSPRMVTAIQEMLLEMHIDGEQIKVEDFPGY